MDQSNGVRQHVQTVNQSNGVRQHVQTVKFVFETDEV